MLPFNRLTAPFDLFDDACILRLSEGDNPPFGRLVLEGEDAILQTTNVSRVNRNDIGIVPSEDRLDRKLTTIGGQGYSPARKACSQLFVK